MSNFYWHPGRARRVSLDRLGKRGIKGSALWNPVQIAVCRYTEKNVSKDALDKHVRAQFADWLDEWKRKKEMP